MYYDPRLIPYTGFPGFADLNVHISFKARHDLKWTNQFHFPIIQILAFTIFWQNQFFSSTIIFVTKESDSVATPFLGVRN